MTQAQIRWHWDRNSATCGNCGAQVMARGGSLGDHNGLSASAGEEESLCGFCAGAEASALEAKLAAVVEALVVRCSNCKGTLIYKRISDTELEVIHNCKDNFKLREMFAAAVNALEDIANKPCTFNCRASVAARAALAKARGEK